MKRLVCGLIGLCLTNAFADSYSVSLPSGLSLIANHLNHPGGNTLNNILPNPPPGTTIYLWNCVGWTAYNFDDIDLVWYPNGLATLNPGEGAMINLPVAANITFTGTPVVPVLPAVLPCGCNRTNLLSRQTTNAPSTFQDVTGVAPTDGASVTRLVGGAYVSFTFSGGAWSPSSPTLKQGESAFIYVPCATNNPVAQKWLQVPDTTTNGIDVYLATTLADDFRCTATGPITEVRIWGSWLNDVVFTNPCFCLGLWTDVPKSATNSYSRPGQLLCETCFNPTQYRQLLYTNVYYEHFWDPADPVLFALDSQVWEYIFTMPANLCWWQTNGNTYWLSLRIPPGCFDTAQYHFGWKTCPTNWNDDAVYGGQQGSAWQELRRPPSSSNSLDLAFQITTGTNTNPCVPVTVSGPNSTTNCVGTIAILAAVASGTGPFTYQWTKDGTTIPGATSSVFALLVTGPLDEGIYCVVVANFCGTKTNCARLQLCATNTAAQKWLQVPDTTPNGIDVRVTDQTMLADDFRCYASGPITEVHIWGSWLNDVVFTNPCFCLGLWSDNPVGPTNQYSMPAQLLCETCFFPNQYKSLLYTNVYWEQFWNPFDPIPGQIDSQVREYVFTMPTNSCWRQTISNTYWLSLRIPPGCFDQFQYQFGWKTCPTNWNDDGVYGYYPGYGWRDLRRPPYYTNSLDLAFQIVTSSNPPPVITNTPSQKWLQVPDASTNGIDVRLYEWSMLADDFRCTATGPITEVRLWGSWLYDLVWTNPCFCLGLWTDIPTNASVAYSRPGLLLCETCFYPGQYTSFLYTNVYWEQFWDPFELTYGLDSQVWEYVFKMPTNSCWWQTNGNTYWLSLRYPQPPCFDTHQYQFGWKTCPTNWNDDGVYGFAPGNGWVDLRRPPYYTNSLDLAFQILTGTNPCPPMTVICPPDRTVVCGSAWSITPPIVNDPCCGTNYTITFTAITNGQCPRVITYFWTVADCQGYTNKCTQLVTLVDTNPPALICASNKVVQCGTSWSFDPPTASDACCGTNVTITVLNTVSNTAPCVVVFTRTWLATDCCTNTAICTQTVTVTNVTPAIVSYPAGGYLGCNPATLPTDNSVRVQVITAGGCGVTTNVTHVDGGSGCSFNRLFTITASNACGSATVTVLYTWTVDTTPPIITCATNKTIPAGTSWTFDPPAASDLCCTNLTVVVENTTTSGICPLVITRTWRAYDCCSNSAVCSQTVTVLGGTPPPNDACSNAIPIAVGSPAACGDTCCATPSPVGSIGNPCGASLSAPDVWYTYTPKCSGQVTVDTCGLCAGQSNAFDTVLSAYSGPCGSLTQVACNDDAGGACGLQSRITFAAVANLTYHIRVAGFAGQCGKFRLNLNATTNSPPNDLCANAIPVSAGSPAYCGTTVCATPSAPGTIPPPCGASANAPDVWFTFTPICSGPITIDTCGLCPGQPSTYDTVLSAYTGPCNGLVQVACNDDAGGPCGLQSRITFAGTAGVTYHIRVAGFILASGPFRLNISAPNLPPPNDDCANAIPVQIGSPAACGQTCCATPSPAGSIPVPCGWSINSRDVWYTWTPQCSGQATIDTCGLCPGQTTTFDTVLSVYTGVCGSLLPVACNDDALGSCGLRSRVSFFAIAGVTYHIRVAGYDTTLCGPFRLNVNQALVPPPNDLCANATPVGNGTYAFNTCGANTDGPTGNTNCLPNQDVWFRYTAPCTGQVWAETCGSSFNTVLAVYTGPCSSLTLVTCNNNATAGPCSGSQNSFVAFNVTAGVTYYLRVGGVGSAQGAGLLTINGPYPAAGTCPPANGPCYWRMFRVMGTANNTPWSWAIQVPCCANVSNTNVPGVATGSSANALAQAFVNSINNACPGGGILAVALPIQNLPGLFLVCVKGCTNTPTPFVFRIGPAGTPPQNQCVVANIGGPIWPPDPLPTSGPCSFNPDLIELWYAGYDYNNNGVDDAIDIMTGTSADLNENGIPDEAENCQVPQILSKPESQVVTLGTNVTLSVTASGTAPLSYQWSHNGVPVAGATTATLTILHPYPADDLGDYFVTVSNTCGSLTAGPFNISVESTTPVAPVITDAEFLKGNFQLTFSSKEGQTYVIEYKDHLTDPSWIPLTTVVGDGQEQQIADVPPLPNIRFYRVRVTEQ